ncbi:unnamed protein product [Blepharisma stoltei]|uniref:Inositol polyphosphate-related phosphatase domain-containing protein n=1 Tax=Blepharisma stoltei TaxID=1481888 RepID=A0AAU9JGJ2_9CILI|nr:unnamed protein product [Blepharisma stoltei]
MISNTLEIPNSKENTRFRKKSNCNESESWVDSSECWAWKGISLPSVYNYKLRILAVTWNMCGAGIPPDISDIINTDAMHHLYIFSTQECLRSIAMSLMYSNKSAWEKKIKNALGSDYYLVASKTLGASHLAIFGHKSLKHFIYNVETSSLSTGFFNMISNKGGIGISMNILSKKLLFIGCHIISGQDKVSKRNKDLNLIEKKFSTNMEADCTILLGDLNYRISGHIEAIDYFISEGLNRKLKPMDQLRNEMHLGNVLPGYAEGEIEFPPTYKYKIGSGQLDTQNERIPSWTDRIMYKDVVGILKQKSYNSIHSNVVSDHKPVFSQFVLKI